jgi:hypothetical protein
MYCYLERYCCQSVAAPGAPDETGENYAAVVGAGAGGGHENGNERLLVRVSFRINTAGDIRRTVHFYNVGLIEITACE